jgi:hypothetical protein
LYVYANATIAKDEKLFIRYEKRKIFDGTLFKEEHIIFRDAFRKVLCERRYGSLFSRAGPAIFCAGYGYSGFSVPWIVRGRSRERFLLAGQGAIPFRLP